MARGINKVILVGNLGNDPEVKYTQGGLTVTKASLATTTVRKDRDGNSQEKTEWHRVVIFNENLGRVAKQYLRKGSSVYLEGQLQTRKWTDQQGVEKYSTEIVVSRFKGELTMLGGRSEGGSSGGGYGGGGGGYGGGRGDDDYSSGFSTGGANKPSGPKESYDLNDDIPF